MNIALFSDSYIPTKSGVVTVVVQLRNILEKLGHKVVVVTVGSKSTGIDQKDPSVLRIRSMKSPVGDGQYIAFFRKRKIIDFLKKNKIELIHSHTEFFVAHMANVAGKALNIPVVATTHTMWEDYYRYYLKGGKLIPKRLIRKTVKLLYKNFYALINVSMKAHLYFNRSYMLPNIPSTIIPNAIDSASFVSNDMTDGKKAELKKSLGISADDRVVSYVGRIVEEKRLEELLEISMRLVKQRENIKFLFVGSGDAIDYLKETVSNNGLTDKIIFTGFVDWSKLSGFYAISDAFVTVSLSEMHSMTILEALALGVPVVCRKDSSFSDTVFHGENGYFAETDEEMDDFILKILDNRNNELWKKMSEKALEISSRFTLENHGKRTEAFYKEVLKNYPEPLTSEQLKAVVDSAI